MEKATLTLEETAKLLGLGRGTIYQMAREGRTPFSLIHAGRRWLVPKAKLFALLGLDQAGGPSSSPSENCASATAQRESP